MALLLSTTALRLIRVALYNRVLFLYMSDSYRVDHTACLFISWQRFYLFLFGDVINKNKNLCTGDFFGVFSFL